MALDMQTNEAAGATQEAKANIGKQFALAKRRRQSAARDARVKFNGKTQFVNSSKPKIDRSINLDFANATLPLACRLGRAWARARALFRPSSAQVLG